MIRRILLASAGVIALAGTSFAADLTPPPPPPPPPPLWTGFYIGINAGGTWSNSNSLNVISATAFNNFAALSALGASYGPAAALGSTGSIPVSTSGFIGGGQIGYNYQFASNWAAGIEADIDGIAGANKSDSVFHVTPRAGFFPPDAVNTAIYVTKNLTYLGTVRGRIGFLVTPTLFAYGTGGLAYGGTKSSTGIYGFQNPNTGSSDFFGVGFSSTARVGWTAGGGVEWMFLPNWSAKIEYLYYDLGSLNYSVGPTIANLLGGPIAFVNTASTSTRFNGNVVRAGLNYHFNWGAPAPVVAKY